MKANIGNRSVLSQRLTSSFSLAGHPFLCGRRREEPRHWSEDENNAAYLGFHAPSIQLCQRSRTPCGSAATKGDRRFSTILSVSQQHLLRFWNLIFSKTALFFYSHSSEIFTLISAPSLTGHLSAAVILFFFFFHQHVQVLSQGNTACHNRLGWRCSV